MSHQYYRGGNAAPAPRPSVSAESYWGQVAALRAQSRRPIVRYRAAVATIAEPLVAATIVLLVCGLVGEQARLLDAAFALSLAIVALIVLTLLASACAATLFGWQQSDGR